MIQTPTTFKELLKSSELHWNFFGAHTPTQDKNQCCYGSEHLPKSPKTDFGFELYIEAYVQELARAVRLRQKLRESDEN